MKNIIKYIKSLPITVILAALILFCFFIAVVVFMPHIIFVFLILMCVLRIMYFNIEGK